MTPTLEEEEEEEVSEEEVGGELDFPGNHLKL